MENEYLKPLWDALNEYGEYPAIVDLDATRSTSYAQLKESILRVMAWIDKQGLESSSFIPIVLESSAEYIAAEVGVWFAGHSAVPAGPAFPQDRIDYICDHCESPFVIDAAAWSEIKDTEPLDIKEPDYPDPSLPALLIYTSGSTGTPKGIIHSFAGLSVKHTAKANLRYSTEDAWGMGAPLYFIASLTVFKVLKEGACLHLYSSDVYHDTDKLADYIEEHGITFTFLSPAMLPDFHNHSESLKLVFTGSERLSGQYSRDGYKLMNCYGMSETGGTVCAFLVSHPYETTPVGHPEEKWALLDEDGNPVAEGEEGEFCLSGRYCEGYFKDPEKTAELYRGGWLHTGDILRQLPDGNLVYVNRKDWMAKINGQRVEPGEVENAIRKITGVRQAVVKAFESESGSQYLCAFFTGDADADAIKEELSTQLPPYMVPSFCVPVREFALLPNGKINRKVLAPPDLSSLQSSYFAPETDLQKRLCEAFASVFGLEQVGIDDDFFLLGGDSIRVMKLQQSCDDMAMSAKMISQARTPRKIAQALEELSGISRVHAQAGPVPLTQTQMGIYVESVARAGEAVYNNPVLLRLSQEIDAERFAGAVQAALAAHPFVNVHIEEGDDGPMLVEGEFNFSLQVEHVTEDEMPGIEKGLIEPFNLNEGPLYRMRLFSTEENLYYFFDFHHIIYDGTSMRIFMADVECAYRGEAVPVETYTGFDVAAREAQVRSTKAYDEARSWYEGAFAGLETDSKPAPNTNGEFASFATYEKTLGVDAGALSRLCKRLGITENTFSIAAFGLLLGAYSNSREALFATIYNGRDDIMVARTIDMMVKTLPVHCQWEANTSVSEYLASVKDHVLSAMAYDLYSFAEVAAIADVTSDVLFAYQGDYLTLGSVCGYPFERVELGGNATGSPLSMQLFIAGGSLLMRAEYRADQYTESFISDMVACYKNIVNGLMTCDRVCDITFVDDKMLERLDLFNKTDVEYDDTQTIVSMFCSAAKANPDTAAVVYEEIELTYAQVDEASDRLARYIASLGIGKSGDVVSILIPRGIWMVVAALGALKAGCAFQPLDATYPTERLNFMMQDAEAKLLITTKELCDSIANYEEELLLVDGLDDIPDAKTDVDLDACSPSPDDLFILLYTSGTTGLPKGVRILHRNIVCFVNWYRRYFGLLPGHKVGAYASFGFDACMMDLYSSLISGATIVIVPEELRLDLVGMDQYYTKHGVTHAFMTTQVGRQFALDGTCPTIKYLMMGGETLVPFDAASSRYKLYNAYGPSECTVMSTVYEIEGHESYFPIGHLIDNYRAYVVGLDGHRLPIGAEGELLLAGPQVGAGYLNRPDKTAEAFSQNPFEGGRYADLYHTGDIVRLRNDAMIDFVGRRDGQVKIRGFRIELSEVEAVVRDYPAVKDATVAAFDNPSGGKLVAAYVVSDEKIDASALADFILDQKPPYMVPASIMQIDAVPLNQNGKVNKRALPEPVIGEMGEEDDDGGRPLNALEERLKDLASAVIGNDTFGVSSPLSRYGLNSILRIKLLTQIYKEFGVNIKAAEIDEISILALENRLLADWMSGGSVQAEDRTARKEFRAPLTFAQMGVYFECLKSPSSLAYNIPSSISFRENVNAKDVELALKRTIAAHPTLSARFANKGENAEMLISEQGPELDYVSLREAELEGYAKRFVRPFDVEEGPLARFSIATVGEKRVVLFCDFHHLAFDGASMGLFVTHILSALAGDNIDDEDYTYSDFAQDQHAFMSSADYEANKAFFSDMLADMESVTELPADKQGRSSQGRQQISSSPIDFDAIKAYCSAHELTPAAVMLGACAYATSRYVNEKSVYLSTISNGRADVRCGNTIGMFVNTLPLAVKVESGTVSEYLASCARVLDGVIAHERYPFAHIAADHGFAPQIVYEYQIGAVDTAIAQAGPIDQIVGLGADEAKFKLSIHIEYANGMPALVLYYNDALYSQELMDSFAASIVIALENMLANPDASVTSVSLLDEKRRKLLEGFHQVQSGPTDFDFYHEGLEIQARLKPEETALIAVDGSFTFEQLNAEANKLAHALIKRGVPKQSRIALLLPRTSRVVISIFGVMKAGCVYIPCDPNYPEERVNHILGDSEALYVITTSDRCCKFSNAVDIEELLQEQNSANPDIELEPDDLAYMIYTSGSTGKPKGVMLTHRGVCNFHSNQHTNILVDALVKEAHRFLCVTTLSFDMSVKEVGTPLVNGLSIVLAHEDQVNDPASLAALAKETGADAFNATHSRLKQYLEHPAFAEAIANCKVVLSGGEKYTEGLLPLLKKTTNARIINTYGPTETTVSSNMKDLTSAERISVGRPLYNVWECVVDSDGNELPPGVVGELLIAGEGVGLGYNKLPGKTKEAFIEYEGRRAYRSGDYARWMQSGEIEILGRTDNQVKLRGLRIEIGEIEAVLASVPKVKSSVVKIAEINGIEHLCAYYVADEELDVADVRAFMSQTLAAYMVPTAYLQLDSMPLTPNGKVDYRNLPAAKLYNAGGDTKAKNETEQAFCDIFAEILGLDNVGAADSFFDIGGTSLMAIRITVEADKMGWPITYSDVFANPTPQMLASLIRGEEAEDEGDVPHDAEIDEYDYSAIDELLSTNTLKAFSEGRRRDLGNIFLTGAVGYLGIHILREFLESYSGIAYCLLRGKGDVDAITRLKHQLFYYFEQSYVDLVGKRIQIIEGDITGALPIADDMKIDTVINCAAVVKHFSSGTEIEDVNVGGVENLIDFCLKRDIPLIQISTGSTVKAALKPGFEIIGKTNERQLYLGQDLANKYVRSKFLAERDVLDAVANKGLDGKIMRVGNLAPRVSDGEFQINYATNAAMGRLKSFVLLGCASYDQLDSTMEFSPIDEVARAILLLAQTPAGCTVFHPFNHHETYLADVFYAMNNCGFDIRTVERAEFVRVLKAAEEDEDKAKILTSMLAYARRPTGKPMVIPKAGNEYTMQVLYRLGFRWTPTSPEYVARFLDALGGLGFFDEMGA